MEFHGSASGLMKGIEHASALCAGSRGGQGSPRRIAQAGLGNSQAGKAIKDLLEEQVNPAVAAHGGHILLVDVQDSTVYIRLEGDVRDVAWRT